MKFYSRLTLRTEAEAAIHDLCVDLKAMKPDLAILFVSHHYGPEFHDLVQGIYSTINCRNLIGCTGESIIGPTSEIESRPAAVLWVAHLPGVRILPFLLDQEDLGVLKDTGNWHDRLGVGRDESPSFIILPDPFSFHVQACLDMMNEHFPGATIVGGMASGATGAGQNRLFTNDQSLRRGLVGVSLVGDIELTAIVSQGCRPVGEPYVITKAQDNLIHELGGKPALAVLQEVFDQADSADQNLMRHGLHMGRLVDEHRRKPEMGNFLVRNMMGVSEDRSLAIGDFLHAGQTVQFHVRDSQSAGAEFEKRLRIEQEQNPGSPGGALLFNCNGRGRVFFQKPNHDIGLVNDIIRDCPTAGFFTQGEIGPIGNRTFIHGYTSSLVLFRHP